VTREDHESARMRANRLVLGKHELDDLVAAEQPALAAKADSGSVLSGPLASRYRLVDLAEAGLVGRDALLALVLHRAILPCR
jgi:hypothetical protein